MAVGAELEAFGQAGAKEDDTRVEADLLEGRRQGLPAGREVARPVARPRPEYRLEGLCRQERQLRGAAQARGAGRVSHGFDAATAAAETRAADEARLPGLLGDPRPGDAPLEPGDPGARRPLPRVGLPGADPQRRRPLPPEAADRVAGRDGGVPDHRGHLPVGRRRAGEAWPRGDRGAHRSAVRRPPTGSGCCWPTASASSSACSSPGRAGRSTTRPGSMARSRNRPGDRRSGFPTR